MNFCSAKRLDLKMIVDFSLVIVSICFCLNLQVSLAKIPGVCDLLTNEVNSFNPGNSCPVVADQQFFQFVELRKVHCPKNRAPSLRPYVLIIVAEHDEKFNTPAIVFSANLYHKKFFFKRMQSKSKNSKSRSCGKFSYLGYRRFAGSSVLHFYILQYRYIVDSQFLSKFKLRSVFCDVDFSNLRG